MNPGKMTMAAGVVCLTAAAFCLIGRFEQGRSVAERDSKDLHGPGSVLEPTPSPGQRAGNFSFRDTRSVSQSLPNQFPSDPAEPLPLARSKRGTRPFVSVADRLTAVRQTGHTATHELLQERPGGPRMTHEAGAEMDSSSGASQERSETRASGYTENAEVANSVSATAVPKADTPIKSPVETPRPSVAKELFENLPDSQFDQLPPHEQAAVVVLGEYAEDATEAVDAPSGDLASAPEVPDSAAAIAEKNRISSETDSYLRTSLGFARFNRLSFLASANGQSKSAPLSAAPPAHPE